MPKRSFIPRTILELLLWYFNFVTKLPKYQTKYQITNEEVAQAKANYELFNYWTDLITQMQEYTKSTIAYRNELLYGVDGNATQFEMPPLPVFAPPPANVVSNIVGFAASIAKRIKSHHLFTETDGQDLGLFGTEVSTASTPQKPSLNIRLVSGGHPELLWKKGTQKGIQIFANYNNGNDWQSIGYDLQPNFTDMHPLPKGNDSSVWKYRIIYVDGNMQPIGDYSDTVSVVVGGAM